MPLDSTICRNPRILLVPGSDGYAAYHADTGRIHRLNASAALILELFDGTRTMREVCADLHHDPGLLHRAMVRLQAERGLAYLFISHDMAVVERYLSAPFFARNGPKSLDRGDFTLDGVDGMELSDGAATLAVLTAAAIARAAEKIETAPALWIVSGGGSVMHCVRAYACS